MKTAVLVCGLIRDGIEVFPNVKKFLFDDINPDVYLHTYECGEKSQILDLYQPKKFVILNKDEADRQIEEYGQRYTHNIQGSCNKPNYLSNIRNRKMVSDLIEGEYGKVVITRFDCYGTQSVKNFFEINELCIPRGGDHLNGIFDLCAWGTQKDILYYCSLFDKVEEYWGAGAILHPESMLRHHINQNPDIKYKRVDIDISLRGNIFNNSCITE